MAVSVGSQRMPLVCAGCEEFAAQPGTKHGAFWTRKKVMELVEFNNLQIGLCSS